ncbi:MAG: hypothetical protein Q8Q11_04135 [bacterium]|nr:hypothetical protein [bacterium]MDZ4248032.1 hypothetical protein [Patescibacteria group bacterium]
MKSETEQGSPREQSPNERLSQILKYGSPGEKMYLVYEFDTGQLETTGCDEESLKQLQTEAARGWQQVARTLAANSVDSYMGSQEAAALKILASEGKFDPDAVGISEKQMDPHRVYRPLEAY